MNATIEKLVEQTKNTAKIHGLDFRCPTCNAGVNRWCIGTERTAGPTDSHPSHPERLALIAR